jgi:hypothetical protein
MTSNPKDDIESRTLHILEKIGDEYEIIKRQGFPSHIRDSDSYYSRRSDATIPERRWHSWANELGIDYLQLEAIFKILEKEGLLEKFEFISEYR